MAEAQGGHDGREARALATLRAMRSRPPDSLRRYAVLALGPGVRHGFADAAALGGFDARAEGALTALGAALEPGLRVVRTRQEHTATVVQVTAADLASEGFERGVDGLVTEEPGLALVALGADCPTLFLAEEAGTAAAVVHCGWRGVAGGIVDRTLELLASRHIEAGRLRAAIGPGARGCCYEVGEEVVDALRDAGLEAEAFLRPYRRADGSSSRAVDLAEGLRRLLTRRGVDPASIEVDPACSICGGERFHSHRRSGARSGRMAGAIALL